MFNPLTKEAFWDTTERCSNIIRFIGVEAFKELHGAQTDKVADSSTFPLLRSEEQTCNKNKVTSESSDLSSRDKGTLYYEIIGPRVSLLREQSLLGLLLTTLFICLIFMRRCLRSGFSTIHGATKSKS